MADNYSYGGGFSNGNADLPQGSGDYDDDDRRRKRHRHRKRSRSRSRSRSQSRRHERRSVHLNPAFHLGPTASELLNTNTRLEQEVMQLRNDVACGTARLNALEGEFRVLGHAKTAAERQLNNVRTDFRKQGEALTDARKCITDRERLADSLRAEIKAVKEEEENYIGKLRLAEMELIGSQEQVSFYMERNKTLMNKCTEMVEKNKQTAAEYDEAMAECDQLRNQMHSMQSAIEMRDLDLRRLEDSLAMAHDKERAWKVEKAELEKRLRHREESFLDVKEKSELQRLRDGDKLKRLEVQLREAKSATNSPQQRKPAGPTSALGIESIYRSIEILREQMQLQMKHVGDQLKPVEEELRKTAFVRVQPRELEQPPRTRSAPSAEAQQTPFARNYHWPPVKKPMFQRRTDMLTEALRTERTAKATIAALTGSTGAGSSSNYGSFKLGQPQTSTAANASGTAPLPWHTTATTSSFAAAPRFGAAPFANVPKGCLPPYPPNIGKRRLLLPDAAQFIQPSSEEGAKRRRSRSFSQYGQLDESRRSTNVPPFPSLEQIKAKKDELCGKFFAPKLDQVATNIISGGRTSPTTPLVTAPSVFKPSTAEVVRSPFLPKTPMGGHREIKDEIGSTTESGELRSDRSELDDTLVKERPVVSQPQRSANPEEVVVKIEPLSSANTSMDDYVTAPSTSAVTSGSNGAVGGSNGTKEPATSSAAEPRQDAPNGGGQAVSAEVSSKSAAEAASIEERSRASDANDTKDLIYLDEDEEALIAGHGDENNFDISTIDEEALLNGV